MSLPIKVGSIILGVGTLGGAGVAGYIGLTRKSFESVLGESVLKLVGSDNQKEWAERIKDLTTSKSKLDDSLNKKIINTWDKLRDWCNSSKNDTFDKDSIKYKNFEEFCTWKIGDKITGHISKETTETDQKWKKAHTALKGKKQDLPQELQSIANAKEANDADKKAMHRWCTDSYKKTWGGVKDTRVTLIEEHCKETNG